MTISDEARNAARLAMKVQGQIRYSECVYLYRLARRISNVAEIGCLQGRSTAVLVQAAKVFKANVTSVDPFYFTPGMKIQSSPEIWRKNLEGIGLKAPELLAMESHEAAKVYDKEIGFLFIDGNHDYEHVKEDIADWAPKIKVEGVIAFHDMFMPRISGVAQAVTEWWLGMFDIRNVTWKLEGMVNFTIAFRRVK